MKRLLLATAVAVLMSAGSARAGVTFNFTFTPGTSAQAQTAFIAAGALVVHADRRCHTRPHRGNRRPGHRPTRPSVLPATDLRLHRLQGRVRGRRHQRRGCGRSRQPGAGRVVRHPDQPHGGQSERLRVCDALPGRRRGQQQPDLDVDRQRQGARAGGGKRCRRSVPGHVRRQHRLQQWVPVRLRSERWGDAGRVRFRQRRGEPDRDRAGLLERRRHPRHQQPAVQRTVRRRPVHLRLAPRPLSLLDPQHAAWGHRLDRRHPREILLDRRRRDDGAPVRRQAGSSATATSPAAGRPAGRGSWTRRWRAARRWRSPTRTGSPSMSSGGTCRAAAARRRACRSRARGP